MDDALLGDSSSAVTKNLCSFWASRSRVFFRVSCPVSLLMFTGLVGSFMLYLKHKEFQTEPHH